MTNRFGRHQRLKKSREFDVTIRRGSCAADDVLVVFSIVAATGDAGPRIGITIPRRTGNAVTRNRWKRLIREAFRTQQAEIPAGFDFVVRPKKGAVADWNRIRRSLPSLARRAVRRLKKN